MRRRDFLKALSGAAMAPLVWPNDALAQQARPSTTIGFLGATTPTFWSAWGNVDSPLIALEMEGVKEDGARLGLETFKLHVTKAEEIVPAIQSLKGVADALYICSDPFLTTHRVRINTLAIAQKLPTVNAFREYVVAGGLLSYGPNFPDLFRRSADYVDKILRGAKPADIPVEQPVKFD